MTILEGAPSFWEINKRDVLLRAFKDPQYEWFWSAVSAGRWEEETFHAFREFIVPGGLYIDIGAWIGPTVLFGGAIAGKIVAIEPDAVAMAALLKNLELNPEIAAKTELYNLALSVDGKPLDLYAYHFGDSMTSKLPSRGAQKITFATMAVDEFLARALGDQKKCFIKIDVEGAEYELLPIMMDYFKLHSIDADLYISLHAEFFIDKKKNVISWTANVARNGALLARLANYGTIHFWSGTSWAPCDTVSASIWPMEQFLNIGGLATTLLVRKVEPPDA